MNIPQNPHTFMACSPLPRFNQKIKQANAILISLPMILRQDPYSRAKGVQEVRDDGEDGGPDKSSTNCRNHPISCYMIEPWRPGNNHTLQFAWRRHYNSAGLNAEHRSFLKFTYRHSTRSIYIVFRCVVSGICSVHLFKASLTKI